MTFTKDLTRRCEDCVIKPVCDNPSCTSCKRQLHGMPYCSKPTAGLHVHYPLWHIYIYVYIYIYVLAVWAMHTLGCSGLRLLAHSEHLSATFPAAFQPRGSKYLSLRALGPKYHSQNGVGTLCHHIGVLGPSGPVRVTALCPRRRSVGLPEPGVAFQDPFASQLQQIAFRTSTTNLGNFTWRTQRVQL